MALHRSLAAAPGDHPGALAQLLDERAHSVRPPREEVAVPLDLGGKEHRRGAYRSAAERPVSPLPAR
jgi:hypothetical protein